MWVGDKAYSNLMRELWGSPGVWNEKKKYVEVAKKLGLDEETVRNRIKYLKESGFLIGWRVVPSPTLLGRKLVFLLIETEDSEESKDKTISELKGKDGVFSIVSIYGNNVLLNVLDDEKKESSKAIYKMKVKMSPLIVPEMNLPRSNFKMTPTDWKIVSLILRDAERNISDIAREVKTSTRTVKRRLNAMMGASAILIMPVVNLKKGSGISYSLMIQCEEDKKDQVDSIVTSRIDNLVFKASASKNGSIFGFTGSNITEGNELLKWVKQLDGVRAARITIAEEVIHVFDWLEREVEKQLSVAITMKQPI